jgi:molybdopterin adenylyltransferase
VVRSSGEAGTVVSVNISRTKGVRKVPVPGCRIVPGLGIEGDAHAGDGHRQVSLLALESIQKMRDVGLDVGPGAFAENITTSGIELVSLPVGTVLRVGRGARLEVSQIGKVCHDRCDIFEQAGDCVMPREGIFARALAGGPVAPGDRIEVESVPDDKEKAMLKGIRFAVLTISDRSARGERADASGPLLEAIVRQSGGEVLRAAIFPDDRPVIRAELEAIADAGVADVVLTTGGTGFAPRDVTPEATRDVLDKEAPGLAEVMRAESLKKTGTAMLSRAVAGIRKSTLIINLPGSPKAARENLEVVLPALAHAVELMKGRVGDCGKP